jgi:hypothetical protein
MLDAFFPWLPHATTSRELSFQPLLDHPLATLNHPQPPLDHSLAILQPLFNSAMAPDEPPNRLVELLNPPPLKDVYDAIFCGDENATALLEKFHVSEYPYQRVWPKNLPKELQTTTKSNGGPYYTELKVFVAAPSALSAASKPTRIRPAVRFHGGGGVSAGAIEPPSLG